MIKNIFANRTFQVLGGIVAIALIAFFYSNSDTTTTTVANEVEVETSTVANQNTNTENDATVPETTEVSGNDAVNEESVEQAEEQVTAE